MALNTKLEKWTLPPLRWPRFYDCLLDFSFNWVSFVIWPPWKWKVFLFCESLNQTKKFSVAFFWFFFFFFFFFFLMAASTTYGSFWARELHLNCSCDLLHWARDWTLHLCSSLSHCIPILTNQLCHSGNSLRCILGAFN